MNQLSPGLALQQPDYAAALRQVCSNVSNYAARQLKELESELTEFWKNWCNIQNLSMIPLFLNLRLNLDR